jgi:DNA-binding XRE family transcriptional regulator
MLSRCQPHCFSPQRFLPLVDHPVLVHPRSVVRWGSPWELQRSGRDDGGARCGGFAHHHHALRELATLKDLRQAVERTQNELGASLGVGQDTISRVERRSDMLLPTPRRYVDAMGGKVELVVEFPDRAHIDIDQLTTTRKVAFPNAG